MMDERYSQNLKAFTQAELDAIRRKSVCVVGCGGLGGFVCHGLARFGIGSLTVVDKDTFSQTNLNRQLFARPDTLGLAKAAVCKAELEKINSDVPIYPVHAMLDESNAEALLRGHDLVIDCLDDPHARILLEQACQALGIVFVHGAISGFTGQVAVVRPGDGIIKRLYTSWEKGDTLPEGNPVFTVQAVSAFQCSEALKLLAGRDTHLNNQLLLVDLLNNVFEIVRV